MKNSFIVIFLIVLSFSYLSFDKITYANNPVISQNSNNSIMQEEKIRKLTFSGEVFGKVFGEVLGEVNNDQGFERQISRNLIFRLYPTNYSWMIGIFHINNPKDNYCNYVTPPFHGPNNIDIMAWHFSKKGHLAAAPYKNRAFSNVINPSDQERAGKLLDIMLHSYGHSESEVDAITEEYDNIKKYNGELQIEKIKISPNRESENSYIKYIKFSVTLELPDDLVD